ncbi:MAG: acetylxylan esterase [Candidatus Firestonebacteria bacterium]
MILQKRILELERIDVKKTALPDFDEFWSKRIKELKRAGLNMRAKPLAYPLSALKVFDLTFDGVDGTPIKAWKVLPEPLPAGKIPFLVHYHGLGGERGFPYNYAFWAAMGIGVFAADARLQAGDTGSNTGFASGSAGSISSMGIENENDFYFGRHLSDSLRAVEAVKTFTEADKKKIIVEGGSQGGGVALAVAALYAGEIFACLADVAGSCWYEKRVMDRTGSATDIAHYLHRHPGKFERVLKTLSYFDNINLAGRIKCPVLASVGLRDNVCPAENVYAAYNKIKSKKRMEVYPFAGHEGGGIFHTDLKLKWLAELLK